MENRENISRRSQTAVDPTKHNYDLDGFPDLLTYKHAHKKANHISEPRGTGQSDENRQVMSVADALSELGVHFFAIRENVNFKNERALNKPLSQIVEELEFMLSSLAKADPQKLLVRYIDFSMLKEIKLKEDSVDGYRFLDVLNEVSNIVYVIAESDQNPEVKNIVKHSHEKIQNLVHKFSTNLQRGFDDYNVDQRRVNFEKYENPVSVRYPEGD